MMKQKRGRPKKLDPVRGEDLVYRNLANNTSSGFDGFDNAAANAVSHQDVLRDAVLATLADRIAGGSNLHNQNSSKYASAFDELPVATRLSMAGLNTTLSQIGIHQALLSETVIDNLVDTIIKRLADRDHFSGQQLPAGKVAEGGYILSSGRQTSMLETLPQRGLASSSALHH
uniref:Uncharacterized protein n=1 Tax=Kalanchoe fedtschenkoi TaxID=63787 RepID=A0A7N0UWA1_KALFE